MEYAVTALVVVALALAFIWAGHRFVHLNDAPHTDLSSLAFWSILGGGYVMFILLIFLTCNFLPALLS